MSTPHDAIAATAARNPDLLRNVLITRTIYTLKDSDDPGDFDALNGGTGEIPLAVSWHETIFWLDPDDATTAHDGTTVLVTNDDYRYKASALDLRIKSVLDRDLTAPPHDSPGPSIGDAYLVKTAATGDWADHDDEIAVYSQRGWVFKAPIVGDYIYVEDEDLYIRYKADGTWAAGPGARAFEDKSVPLSALINVGKYVIVENQTTNTPPSSPVAPVAYIIGSSPTGAWSGKAGQIAICEADGSWTYYTPTNGWSAYDKALSKRLTYTGLAWAAGADACVLIETKTAAGDATIDFLITAAMVAEFDHFELVISAAKPQTDDVEAWLRVGTGAGPTYQTSGYRYGASIRTDSGTANLGLTSAAKIMMSISSGTQDVGNGAGETFNAKIIFNKPAAGDIVVIEYSASYWGAGNFLARVDGVGSYATAVALTAIRFMFESGNVAAGRFSLFGYRNS